MSNIAIFEPNKIPQYLTSVNEPDYCISIPPSKDVAQQYAKPGILINPDISVVKDVPLKYWKKVNNQIQEMTLVEKQVMDDTELQIRKSMADTFNVDIKEILEAFINVINLRLPQDQEITKQEIITIIKKEIQ